MCKRIVTGEHIREANLCVRGARQWFRLHNLDFDHFVRHGYPVETIEATGDVLGLKVAKIARDEAAQELK